ncbi:hypothetical protein [Herbaspirillum huttiense]|uniref:Uncharacterized protein n=2 Tax=Herbaspirillum huttiense TaxID=863372 RepID=A0AAJ2LTX4_9BURK|nr:hypothetical protein [Herbaspirillum huttiense]MDR9839417.1 hypothetical protein [Herbaspirillum huttiense]
MALTKDERRALELAREKIASEQAAVVCYALKLASEEYPDLRQAVERLQDYIGVALEGGGSTLTRWQLENGFYRGNVRADRLAWIDWMLGKPLPGEAVEIKWKAVGYKIEEGEYCGRFFRIVWAEFQQRWLITELNEMGVVTAAFAVNKRTEIDAAIVAHVWPEA